MVDLHKCIGHSAQIWLNSICEATQFYPNCMTFLIDIFWRCGEAGLVPPFKVSRRIIINIKIFIFIPKMTSEFFSDYKFIWNFSETVFRKIDKIKKARKTIGMFTKNILQKASAGIFHRLKFIRIFWKRSVSDFRLPIRSINQQMQ